MHDGCKWLTPPVEAIRGENSVQYLARLYPLFKDDFVKTHPVFNGKRVIYNSRPIIHGYEEAFFHITHADYDKRGFENRTIDYARSECIQWIKEIIEHYPCTEGCCPGIKVWKVKRRIHFLFEKERYLVVIEERGSEYQLVTAFRINYAHELKIKLRQYEEYKNKVL
ncbi:MAG: hypothetical protein PUA95_08335 [Lactimicrobium massiliense]|nr:hypothetical protein [Lactimicrobium massiliense]MDD6230728.1 hypothetical protein [Lactimicrobium massiliense]MDD6726867.1 hypothetical protein [Lactimicrobium massiliense]